MLRSPTPAIRGLSLGVMLMAIGGCTQLVKWNPVYKGAEMHKSISFNLENVGVRIKKFGFWNSSYDPTGSILLKNYSRSTVVYDFRQCVLLFGDETIPCEEIKDSLVTLEPGRSATRTIEFNASLEDSLVTTTRGKKHFIPLPSTVELLLGTMTIGDRTVEIPSVEFAYPYKELRRTKVP